MANGGVRVGRRESAAPTLRAAVRRATIQSSAMESFPTGGLSDQSCDRRPELWQIAIYFTGNYHRFGGSRQHRRRLHSFGGSGEACIPSSIAADVITVEFCPGLSGFANGWETSFDVSADLNTVPPLYNVMISSDPRGQKLYIINCNSSCGSGGGRFQISYTPGGPPITGLTCLAANNCNLGFVLIGNPLQVTAGSATWTSPDTLISWANGTLLTLSATNAEDFGGSSIPPFNL